MKVTKSSGTVFYVDGEVGAGAGGADTQPYHVFAHEGQVRIQYESGEYYDRTPEQAREYVRVLLAIADEIDPPRKLR